MRIPNYKFFYQSALLLSFLLIGSTHATIKDGSLNHSISYQNKQSKLNNIEFINQYNPEGNQQIYPRGKGISDHPELQKKFKIDDVFLVNDELFFW